MIRILFFLIFLIISGCGVFYSPKEQPVSQKHMGELFGDEQTNVFSLTPERRTVIVKTSKTSPKPMFCAEPPPDVAENIASNVRAIIEASAKAPTGSDAANANIELARTLSSSSISLFYRSQGVQLFRDGIYNLCQSYMNGMITSKEEYQAQYKALLDRSYILISQEIPTVQSLRNIEIANQITNAKTAAESAMQKAIEAETSAKKYAEQLKEATDTLPK